MVIWLNQLVCLKMFLFFKTERDITPFLQTSRVTLFFKVLITNAGSSRYFNAISEKHLCYSLFVKRIIGSRSNVSLNDQGDPLWAHSTPPLVHRICTRSKQGIPAAWIQSRCTLPESGAPPHCALRQ